MIKNANCIALVIAALALGACATAPQHPQTWDGLDLYPQKKLSAVYLKPDASFARYTEIMIDPLHVSFDKNWDPQTGTTSFRRVDVDKIKGALAAGFKTVFEETLTADGKYRIVTEAGPNTLHIIPAIVDLYINAPDTSMQTAGRVTSYTVDPGRMTLAAEFRDGTSDALLARVVDKEEGIESGFLQVTNSVTNTADAKRIMKKWAKIVRDGLDNVHAAAASPKG